MIRKKIYNWEHKCAYHMATPIFNSNSMPMGQNIIWRHQMRRVLRILETLDECVDETFTLEEPEIDLRGTSKEGVSEPPPRQIWEFVRTSFSSFFSSSSFWPETCLVNSILMWIRVNRRDFSHIVCNLCESYHEGDWVHLSCTLCGWLADHMT